MARARKTTAPLGHRISDLVEKTGLSKELIHHYLRQGLLPRPGAPASYTDEQVRLLRVIRALREEHNLPLEAIRRVVEAFDFDPDLLEPILLAETPARRLRAFADEGALTAARTLTAEELAAEAGVSAERIAELRALSVIGPLEGAGEGAERFSAADATTVMICERGLAAGLRLDSLRTVASHVRLAFELEHAEFFDLDLAGRALEAEAALRELYVRRELVGAFVQSVLGSLVDGHLRRALRRPVEPGRAGLDAVVYRPSQAFLRRHGILERIEAARARLGADPSEPRAWLEAAELQLHAGFDREAAFLLEQALARFPGHGPLRTQLGIALALLGETARARALLAELVDGPASSPVARIYLALVLWASWPRQDRAGSREAAAVLGLVERGLEEAGEAGSVRARLFGAWLLSALPRAMGRGEEGARLLIETLEELRQKAPAFSHLPGLRERYLMNAAYLAFECLGRRGLGATSAAAPDLEELRALVCRLDPACAFAAEVYLAHGTPGLREGERRGGPCRS